jgi:tetratricopeptide (TPR) repeat protein
MAQSILIKPENMKKERIITLMQLAGLAACNLKYYSLSTSYLKQSATLAEEINNPAFTARSYMFLSLVSGEMKQFSESEVYYSKAVNQANKLEDTNGRLNAQFLISGYYGKIKLLEGNFDKAAQAYQETLLTLQELKLNNNLELSQVNEGLATALKELNRLDEAQQYLAIAKRHRRLAENNKQIANCFLSFIPTQCNALP